MIAHQALGMHVVISMPPVAGAHMDGNHADACSLLAVQVVEHLDVPKEQRKAPDLR